MENGEHPDHQSRWHAFVSGVCEILIGFVT
jgi:hypothetical protein